MYKYIVEQWNEEKKQWIQVSSSNSLYLVATLIQEIKRGKSTLKYRVLEILEVIE